MGFFRKKVKLNEIYRGIVMDMLQPETQPYALVVLFPNLKYSETKNRPKVALEEQNFDQNNFVVFMHAMVISSVASLASWIHPNQFYSFDQVIKDEDLNAFCNSSFDLQDFGSGLIEFLNNGNKKNINEDIKAGSKIYGRKSTMPFDQAEMFETATISLSYMIEYFNKHSPEIANAININQASSRDSLISFNGYVVRYWNYILKNIKPDLF